MTAFVLSQILATFAFGCGVISFQCRRRRAVLLWLSASALVNACHFFVLQRPAPGTLFVIMAARSLAAAYTVNRVTMCVFLGLVVAGFAYSYTDALGFLAVAATLLATYGSFQRSDQTDRLFFMTANGMWAVHNIVVGTPVAALMEATFLASNLVGYWRFHRGGRATPAPEVSLTKDGPG